MSRALNVRSLAATLALAGLAACDQAPKTSPEGLEGEVTVDRLAMPTDPKLVRGREIWAGTCSVCHGSGLAGAPKITNQVAWAPRIAKGMDTLVSHALGGFAGASGEMPARGGNPQLSDEDVAAAVAFMVSNSQPQDK